MGRKPAGRLCTEVTALFSLICSHAVAGATYAAPDPFVNRHELGDGRHILIMHSPKLTTNATWAMNRLSDEQKALFTTYPRSGLYPADGSREPVWTIPSAWHCFVGEDAVHVVQSSREDSCSEFVVTFFRSGEKIRTYQTADLVSGGRETLYRSGSSWADRMIRS